MVLGALVALAAAAAYGVRGSLTGLVGGRRAPQGGQQARGNDRGEAQGLPGRYVLGAIDPRTPDGSARAAMVAALYYAARPAGDQAIDPCQVLTMDRARRLAQYRGVLELSADGSAVYTEGLEAEAPRRTARGRVASQPQPDGSSRLDLTIDGACFARYLLGPNAECSSVQLIGRPAQVELVFQEPSDYALGEQRCELAAQDPWSRSAAAACIESARVELGAAEDALHVYDRNRQFLTSLDAPDADRIVRQYVRDQLDTTWECQQFLAGPEVTLHGQSMRPEQYLQTFYKTLGLDLSPQPEAISDPNIMRFWSLHGRPDVQAAIRQAVLAAVPATRQVQLVFRRSRDACVDWNDRRVCLEHNGERRADSLLGHPAFRDRPDTLWVFNLTQTTAIWEGSRSVSESLSEVLCGFVRRHWCLGKESKACDALQPFFDTCYDRNFQLSIRKRIEEKIQNNFRTFLHDECAIDVHTRDFRVLSATPHAVGRNPIVDVDHATVTYNVPNAEGGQDPRTNRLDRHPFEAASDLSFDFPDRLVRDVNDARLINYTYSGPEDRAKRLAFLKSDQLPACVARAWQQTVLSLCFVVKGPNGVLVDMCFPPYLLQDIAETFLRKGLMHSFYYQEMYDKVEWLQGCVLATVDYAKTHGAMPEEKLPACEKPEGDCGGPIRCAAMAAGNAALNATLEQVEACLKDAMEDLQAGREPEACDIKAPELPYSDLVSELAEHRRDIDLTPADLRESIAEALGYTPHDWYRPLQALLVELARGNRVRLGGARIAAFVEGLVNEVTTCLAEAQRAIEDGEQPNCELHPRFLTLLAEVTGGRSHEVLVPAVTAIREAVNAILKRVPSQIVAQIMARYAEAEVEGIATLLALEELFINGVDGNSPGGEIAYVPNGRYAWEVKDRQGNDVIRPGAVALTAPEPVRLCTPQSLLWDSFYFPTVSWRNHQLKRAPTVGGVDPIAEALDTDWRSFTASDMARWLAFSRTDTPFVTIRMSAHDWYRGEQTDHYPDVEDFLRRNMPWHAGNRPLLDVVPDTGIYTMSSEDFMNSSLGRFAGFNWTSDTEIIDYTLSVIVARHSAQVLSAADLYPPELAAAHPNDLALVVGLAADWKPILVLNSDDEYFWWSQVHNPFVRSGPTYDRHHTPWSAIGAAQGNCKPPNDILKELQREVIRPPIIFGPDDNDPQRKL